MARVFKFRSDLAQSQREQERAWKEQRPTWMEQERSRSGARHRFGSGGAEIAVGLIVFLAVAVFVVMAIWRGSEPAAASVPWKDWNPE